MVWTFAFLNGRLSGTVEYYITNTKDILFNVNLPVTSGVSSYHVQYWGNPEQRNRTFAQWQDIG